MRWKIRGFHAPSLDWKSAIVDAPTKQEAQAIAAAGGLTHIEARGERSKWFKVASPLFLVAMFGIGLLQAYYHGNRNSPRDMGAIVGAHVFGAGILLAISALIRQTVGKLLLLVGVPMLAIGLSLLGWKGPTPKTAVAQDLPTNVPHQMSEMRKALQRT